MLYVLFRWLPDGGRHHTVCCTCCSDGYPMEDVIMRWLGGGGNKRESVHGVDNVEIPQFSIADYKISSTIEELQTGA